MKLDLVVLADYQHLVKRMVNLSFGFFIVAS